MSRCFPFPPPGYEKKTRTDEVDLLKKEKKREKKHKKDKGKEKRDSKEKREKEGRDGKHKEKDKKEKHREKKKDKVKARDKGRDRDKSKTSTAEEKGFPGQVGVPNAGSFQTEVKHDKDIFVVNKLTKQYNGNNGEKARENNHLAEESKDTKFLLELDRRIKVDDGGAGNQLVQKFTNADHRKDEGTFRLVSKGSGARCDSGEKLRDKGYDANKIDGKGAQAEVRPIGNATLHNHTGNFHPRADGMPKIDGKGAQAEVRPIGNATVQNHTGNFHPRADGLPKLLGKYFDRNLEATVEGKEKVLEKKDERKEMVTEKKIEEKEQVKEKKDDKRGVKRKDKEEKKGHGKDKDRDKKKKEKRTKEHTELKTTEQNKIKESNIVASIDSNSLPRVSKNSNENAISGENLKKRKDIESNGVPHANDNLPSKLPKPSSSRPFTENGRILEPCQISIPNASDRPGVAAASVKVENKACKINGIIEARPIVVSSNKTHTATVPAIPVTETPAKPSHPDMKYLSGVYSVPKVEWSNFDDQEWLFGSSISQERKPVVKSSEAGETLQVWAEVVHLETADVFALPYVVPY